MSTPEMGLVLPTDGGSSNVWAPLLDACFTTIDSHSHLTGSGVPVVAAALNINSDLSFVGNALTNGKVVAFAEQAAAAVTSYVDAMFVNSADHNLYFRNSSGVNVQITSGSTINVSIVGGIGGDYASVNALLSYDDATRRYLLQQEGAPRPWAGVATADIDLYQKALIAGSPASNKVTLKSPAALAATYSLTFPAAIPGAQSLVQMDTSGNLLTSNTLATGTLGHTAAWTYKIPACAGYQIGGSSYLESNGGYFNPATGTLKLAYPLPQLQPGDKIVAYRAYVNKASTSGSTISVGLWGGNAAAGTSGLKSSGATSSASSPGGISVGETGLAITIVANTAAGDCHYVLVTPSGSASDLYFHVEVDITH